MSFTLTPISEAGNRPTHESTTELRTRLQTARNAISGALSTLALAMLQERSETGSTTSDEVEASLIEHYATVYEYMETEGDALDSTLTPTPGVRVGARVWRPCYELVVDHDAVGGATIQAKNSSGDVIVPFTAFAPGDTIEILTAEDAANNGTYTVHASTANNLLKITEAIAASNASDRQMVVVKRADV